MVRNNQETRSNIFNLTFVAVIMDKNVASGSKFYGLLWGVKRRQPSKVHVTNLLHKLTIKIWDWVLRASSSKTTKPYQFPVLLEALVAVKDVVNTASVALQRDFPSLLTAGGTLALTGRKHQVLLPSLFVLHKSENNILKFRCCVVSKCYS